MTVFFFSGEKARRKKAAKAAKEMHTGGYGPPPTWNSQPSGYPPPMQSPPPTWNIQSSGQQGPMQSPPQASLPAISLNHQWPNSHAPQPPRPQLLSLPPPQPYVSHSNLNLPLQPQQSESRLKSSFNRVDNVVHRASKSVNNLSQTLTSKAGKSATDLSNTTTNYVNLSSSFLAQTSTSALNQSAALCDRICSKFDSVLTSIDGEQFSGNEQDLVVDDGPLYPASSSTQYSSSRGLNTINAVGSTGAGSNYFSKVWLYANSRLPPHMPPFKVYMPTYPLLCLAAQYSERVYVRPTGSERDTHVDANWRNGTKAMVLKSIPIDDMNIVVFAIRGSQTFMDWTVNFRPAPTSPTGFLDDPGNLCHAGFLHVARQMVDPVASRLRTLLQENPARSNCSLLITGHSAGGAVAALLYAHMMSTTVHSELNYLTGFFKRVHCITFGTPPVSLLALDKPSDKRHRKSLYYSFINEGDPVPRADKQVIKSLLRLYALPAPSANSNVSGLTTLGGSAAALASLSTLNLSTTALAKQKKTKNKPPALPRPNTATSSSSSGIRPSLWKVPPSTLSTAGRLVVLRHRPGTVGEQNVEAVVATDEQLRGVVYGDPMMHMMRVYARRIELLATRAVTVGGF